MKLSFSHADNCMCVILLDLSEIVGKVQKSINIHFHIGEHA